MASVGKTWIWYSVTDGEAIRNYVASSIKGRQLVDRLPESAGPLAATWRRCILTAW